MIDYSARALYLMTQQQRRCHREVEKALRLHKLRKPKRCERCLRESEKLRAHHDDYSKPLEVTWLCPACHQEIHELIRNSTYAKHLPPVQGELITHEG